MPTVQLTDENIFRLLRSSNPFGFTRVDEILPRILKEGTQELDRPFYNPVKQPLNSGALTQAWKIA